MDLRSWLSMPTSSFTGVSLAGGWSRRPRSIREAPGPVQPASRRLAPLVPARYKAPMRARHALLVGGLLGLIAATGHGQTAGAATELFYSSGGLRIQAYLYRPAGDGPFPAVVYNHGSRTGRERDSLPFAHIGALLEGAGYVVLVPERRGYGRSDGT